MLTIDDGVDNYVIGIVCLSVFVNKMSQQSCGRSLM